MLAAAALPVFTHPSPAQPTAMRTVCRAAPGAEANVNLFVRWTDEVWREGKLDLVPQLAGPTYLRHENNGTRTVTATQYADDIASTRRAIPDVRFVVHDCFAEGDRIWTRWTMVGTSARNGEAVRRMGSQVYRVADGKLVETWVQSSADGPWPEVPALPAGTRGAADLVGTWEMVEDQALDAQGNVVERDRDVAGVITYTAEGRVAVQIMYKHGRPTVSTAHDVASTGTGLGQIKWPADAARAAIDTYDAYFGTFEVDAARQIVTHHALGELRPNGVGASYRRKFEFHGDELWLSPADPGEHWRVVWRRVRGR
jgi:hypothetical protein